MGDENKPAKPGDEQKPTDPTPKGFPAPGNVDGKESDEPASESPPPHPR